MVLNILSEWYLAGNQRFGILEFFNRIGQERPLRFGRNLSAILCPLLRITLDILRLADQLVPGRRLPVPASLSPHGLRCPCGHQVQERY
jgi:hypothetical protein